MAVGRRHSVQFGRRNFSEATMWVVVGEAEESMIGAMYQEPGCGCR